jgi:hypothetical protein
MPAGKKTTTMSLKDLRELARKRLGAGHSKLKTRDQLLAALKKWLPKPVKEAAKRVGKAAAASRTVAKKAVGKVTAKRAANASKAAPKDAEPSPKRASAAPGRARGRKPAAPRAAKERPEPHDEEAQEEPLAEGFFVARVVSEAEARRHHLTESEERGPPPASSPPAPDPEHLGELPASYGDDANVLLPKDPNTLFLFWDFSAQTRRAAAEGLIEPRALLRVYEGGQLLREVDFALESRSFYLHGLPAGGRYRVEACFVGRDGRSHRIGPPTREVELPRLGPSPNLTARFLRLPWGLRISRLKEWLARGQAAYRGLQGESYLDLWRRVRLPGSNGPREVWETVGFGGRESGSSEVRR